MANTYHQIYIQAVFAVKYRATRIRKQWKSQLLGVIGNLINETGATLVAVNCVEVHVHCLFYMKPSQSVSDIMQIVKAKSSKWLNESGLVSSRFEWQVGYGAFSYNKREIGAVIRYIQNQELHHQRQTFSSEYKELLTRRGIAFDEQFLFEEMQ